MSMASRWCATIMATKSRSILPVGFNFIPTSSLDPHKENDVTFQKYGDTGYLQTLSLEGETDGIEFPRTKAEAKAETMARNTNENTKVVEQARLVSGK